MKILVIGANGSIGIRHLANLHILDYRNIDTIDICGQVKYTSYKEIKNPRQYQLLIIATPTNTHLEILDYFDEKIPYIMCEKPLCLLHEKIGDYKSQVYINHAYTCDRGYNKLKELIHSGVAGRIKHVTMENAYAFHKLHQYPWENYDGILLDDSHIFNMAIYLFGYPQKILFSMVKKEIVQCAWETEKEILVSITTDCVSERYKKRVEIKGEKGNLIHNFRAHEIFFAPADESERIAIPFKHCCHLMESTKYVLETVEKNTPFTKNTIEDAKKDMEILRRLM